MFQESLKQGKLGEYVIRDYLERQEWVKQVINLSSDERYQQKDIDLMVETKNNQFRTLEIKTDYQAHETGNIAYEMTTSGNIGCLEKTEADYVVFFIPEQNIAYNSDTNVLRQYVHDNCHKWELKPMGDNSEGYLISIGELLYKKIITNTFKEVM